MVRITSIDGTYNPTHPRDLYVHPGDVIIMGADLFVAANGFQPARLPVEAFLWSSTLSNADFCDASRMGDCLLHSDFQVTDYGVAYYVPYNMPQIIQLSVRSNQRVSAATPDTIVLHNMDFDGRPALLPSAPIMLPQEYPAPTLDPNIALAGQGRWITLNGVRYFTPYTYTVPGETEWMPYRHGYWAWEGTYGWTWISYDPWGWMTAHYGVWRHHAVYGWVWLPFQDRHYEPHCVTWFNSGEYVGWYPYAPQFPAAYTFGAVEGFDDGFWLGFRVGAGFGGASYIYHPGYSIVALREVTQPNMINVIVNREARFSPVAINIVIDSTKQNRFFPHPGGDQAHEREFLEKTASQPAAVTVASQIKTKGGASFIQPKAINQVPPESQFLRGLNPMHKTIAVGSMVQMHNGTPQVIPPSTNGRGIVAAPLVRNSDGKPIGSVRAKTNNPAQAHPENPVALRGVKATPPVSALAVHQMPKLNPQAKTPGPRIPVSVPIKGGSAIHVRPQQPARPVVTHQSQPQPPPQEQPPRKPLRFQPAPAAPSPAPIRQQAPARTNQPPPRSQQQQSANSRPVKSQQVNQPRINSPASRPVIPSRPALNQRFETPSSSSPRATVPANQGQQERSSSFVRDQVQDSSLGDRPQVSQPPGEASKGSQLGFRRK